MRNRRDRLRHWFLGCAALVVCLSGLLVGPLLTEPSTGADVLVNSPASSVCLGRTFQVGVWYQSYSGGPHAYWVEVFASSGKLVLNHFGDAPTVWSYWNVRASAVGTYRTIYITPAKNEGVTTVERTTAERC